MIDIDTMTPEQLEHELARCAHECFHADRAYVEANELFKEKDDARRSVFSVIVEGIIARTTAEKERLAYIEPAWGNWLKEFAKIRLEASNKRILRDNWLRRWETIRSILSSKNSGRRMGM
jgi:hypothetical protein